MFAEFVDEVVHLEAQYMRIYFGVGSHRAEELAQDVLLKFWANRAYNPHAGYIKASVRNKMIDEVRRLEFRFTYEPYEIEGVKGHPMEREAPDNTEETVLRKERNEFIREAIAQLPTVYREIIMDYAVGYSYQDMVERYRIPLGTVKSRLSYAKQRLRSLLEGYDWT